MNGLEVFWTTTPLRVHPRDDPAAFDAGHSAFLSLQADASGGGRGKYWCACPLSFTLGGKPKGLLAAPDLNLRVQGRCPNGAVGSFIHGIS